MSEPYPDFGESGSAPDGPIHLEPASEIAGPAFHPTPDRRPVMRQPLPVKLIAVADVRLAAPAGVGRRLDAFYVGLFGFERIPGAGDGPGDILVYRAENFQLRLEVADTASREGYRPLGVEVLSLAGTAAKLVEAEVEFTHQRGLMPGIESLVLTDPAGNWLEVVENQPV